MLLLNLVSILFISNLCDTILKFKLESRKFGSSLREMWAELQSVLSFNRPAQCMFCVRNNTVL